ncbi:MAG: hypothetical protein RIS44_78 [Pseudomonadota bacterium]|jgi:hypothetical protein
MGWFGTGQHNSNRVRFKVMRRRKTLTPTLSQRDRGPIRPLLLF